jgi:hypothetical protein
MAWTADRREGARVQRLSAMFDWMFRSRTTGRITIAQFPNVALGVFLAASVADGLFDPDGGLDAPLRMLATGALVWWAVDELLRGVNPWRRMLGGAVLAGQLVRLAT